MLYVAVDQHARQLTVSVRSAAGDVMLRRQVSTEWVKVRVFWAGICEQSPEGFVVILEVCGLNDWLVALLQAISGCQLVLVQAPQRASTKTDRRDADRLGERLWVNRLAAGRRSASPAAGHVAVSVGLQQPGVVVPDRGGVAV